MATFYVAKTGNDSNDGSIMSPVLTIGAAITLVGSSGDSSNSILIGQGTYTETVAWTGDNLTIKSLLEDRDNVIITQSSGRTIQLNKDSTGNVFQHLTIQNTDNTSSDSGMYGNNGSGTNYASFTVEDCIFDCKPNAVYYTYASTFKRTKFLINGNDSGSDVYAIRTGVAASGATFNIESCLFVGWDKWAINGSGGYCTVRNCTLVLDDSAQSTSYLMYWSGNNVEVYNTIFYGGDSAVDYGLRFQATDSSNAAKNCIAFGALRIPYYRTESPTVSSQLEDNDDVVADGNTIFTAIGDAGVGDDYTINTSGLAYQRGLAAELPSDGKDVDGNTFNASSPNIGAYATVTGWSAGSKAAGVAVGSIGSVVGVAKASISKIKGV